MTEQKPFEYMELLAMCMLCSASALDIMLSQTDPKQTRFDIEEMVKEIIATRWDHPDKQVIK